MARLNISVPDALYERLDRQRDRVNASKVCATALQKELDMIEGRTARPAGNSVERLVQRLQGKGETWHRRGRADGETWAADFANVEELREIGEEWEDDGHYDVDDDELPGSFQWRGHMFAWVLSDVWGEAEWERLRTHLADALNAPRASVRLGCRERHFLLKQLGFPVSETGHADRDEASTNACAAFRRQHGLPPANHLGLVGWAALLADYGPRLGLPEVNGAELESTFDELMHQGVRWHYLRGWHHGARDVWSAARERLVEEPR